MEQESHSTQPTPESSQEVTQPLYPERPSEGIDDEIQKLALFEAGKGKQLELTPGERAEIITLEQKAGTTLEAIHRIVPVADTYYPEYFLTPEGRADFIAITGEVLTDDMGVDDVKKILFTSEALRNTPVKERANMAGRSRDYDEEQRFVTLKGTRDAEGKIDITKAAMPDRLNVIFTPELKRKKLTLLRTFKSNLKHYDSITHPGASEDKSPDFQKAFDGIVRLYLSRVNDLIIEELTDRSNSVFTLDEKRDLLGEEALTLDEQKILEKTFGINTPDTTLARYDKFTFGASQEYDKHSGERDQVSNELAQFANEHEADYIASLLNRSEQIRTKGLDPEKIAASSIPIEEVIRLGEDTLAHYGLLSVHPASEYSKDRSGPAPDGKWQFVARDEFKSLAVEPTTKIIKCSRKPQAVDRLISITLAHEIEGHVLQVENRAKIPLQLFKVLGGGRAAVFSECGAMNNQDFVSQEAFGFSSLPHPHYVRGMERKLAGGNYLDCVEAFYNSALKSTQLKKELGKLTPETFEKECDSHLKLAIERAKRLFATGSDFASHDGLLTKSRDTVYLEQVKLYRALKKHGLEKYVFVSGANLNTLLFLFEAGFINPKDIKEPEFYSLQIWDDMKSEYTLNQQS